MKTTFLGLLLGSIALFANAENPESNLPLSEHITSASKFLDLNYGRTKKVLPYVVEHVQLVLENTSTLSPETTLSQSAFDVIEASAKSTYINIKPAVGRIEAQRVVSLLNNHLVAVDIRPREAKGRLWRHTRANGRPPTTPASRNTWHTTQHESWAAVYWRASQGN